MSEDAWTEESLGQKSAEELKALLAAQGAEAASEEPAALVAQLLALQAARAPAAEPTAEPPVKRAKTEDGEVATSGSDSSDSESRTVFIDGLVRPLNAKTLQAMLEARAGRVAELWLNAIKTHCYATFERAEDAARARTELQGVRWPETNPGALAVRASSAAEAADARAAEAAAIAADAARSSSSGSSSTAAPEEREEPATPTDAAPAAPAEPPVEVPLPAEYAQHYNRTETQPPLYWLPRDGRRLDQ